MTAMNDISTYRTKVDDVCSSLRTLSIPYFSMVLSFNKGGNIVLSNCDGIIQAYQRQAQLAELNAESLTLRLNAMCAENYGLYPVYHILRKHSECTFSFSVILDKPIANEIDFYYTTLNQFESFCVNFVDEFVDLIIETNPAYRFSFVFTNKALREAVIKQGYENKISLSLREQECILLTAQGKQPKLIARELNISPFTVEQYLKKIRRQLNCETITQAIFECIQRGLIGCDNPFQREKPSVAMI
ncbi:LuxR family transcriptional regulatory, chaperone HchA-associated [Legionella massiliensis]|uniref:LuxR family transcriptional regulatory, chaperone HchA-associated n=1 Tax=Legionella massiliensis TaxID=1034943 RepID=A0A078L640_9GAMM|nr:helix-turn-helix transcriptional regulator [Legionella massiliensis]CDZ79393.1 LuxR family transcriptional regulatory, chaperone HchA-associated [Legionella massiliensis]CEE15131.1 Bacterial regulatory proteins, luxR family [Legionella massiliensis]